MAFKVTPWEVKGNIDYDRLIQEFGLQKFKEVPKQLEEFIHYRRGIIFAHRDFNRINDAIKNKKPFAMMTGLMPTGKMHFGHKLLMDQVIFYQNLGAKVYVTVADIEAYNARDLTMKQLHENAVNDYLTNYVAMGLDLNKCDFYFQSARSNDYKKSNAYYKLAGMLAKHATFNEFKAVYGEITPGKMTASLLQASDMLHCQLPELNGPIPTLIPVGTDQDPHIRLARDISQRIKEFNFIQLSSTYHVFMPGLSKDKMSSSDPTSFVALTDSPEDAERKIKKYAFSGGQVTLEEHRKKGGNPDVDVAYQFLRYGLEPDDKKLKNIYDDYKSGKLLSGELKQITCEKLKTFLKKHHEEREKAKKKIDKYMLKL